MTLYNNPYNRADAQDAPIQAECDCCGAELYAGQDVYEFDDGYLACDLDCLLVQAGAKRATVGE